MYPVNSEKRYLGHFVTAINISAFVIVAKFKKNLSSMCNELKSVSPWTNSTKVVVPGDPEKTVFSERIKNGIPIEGKQYNKIIECAKKINIRGNLL